MSFDAAARIADAVLYEGYLLYPYRASAAKNRVRWQFGVLAPKPPGEDGEPWFSQTECLVEPIPVGRVFRPGESGDAPGLSLRVRFLRVRATADDRRDGAWLNGTPRHVDFDALPLATSSRVLPFDADGLAARLVVDVGAAGTAYWKLQVRLENLEPWQPAFADRDVMLQHSLVSAHLLLGVHDACFVSLLEPSADAAGAAAGCTNRHTWPVLVGDRSRRDVMLSSPIVLYDFPAVAPESPGDLCDGAEIDEILSLRILTLTEDEKREARATDPLAAQIIDRTEAMTPEALAQLHGTMRSTDFFNPAGEPSPDEASVVVAGVTIAKGSRVRLRPVRRADAMDMFLRDQPATVAGVYRDVDGRTYIAITVDIDPAAELHGSFGRFFYFSPEEVDPLVEEQSA